MRRGISNRCGEKSLPANLIEGRENRVAANQQMLIFLSAALYALHEHRRGKASVLQNALAESAWRWPCGVDVSGKLRRVMPRERESLPCLCQRRRRSNSLPPIFTSRSLHGNEIGQCGDLILSGKDDIRRSRWDRESGISPAQKSVWPA